MSQQNFLVEEINILVDMIQYGYFDDEEILSSLPQLINTTTKEEFFNSPVFKKQKATNDMMVNKLSGKNEANVGPPCRVCGNETFYVSAQTRAADEAITNKLNCPACGNIEYC